MKTVKILQQGTYQLIKLPKSLHLDSQQVLVKRARVDQQPLADYYK